MIRLFEKKLFKAIGLKERDRANRYFAWVLALPFFFVPTLIIGFGVAHVGETFSKRAVTFLQNTEARPAGAKRVAVAGRKKKSVKKPLVANALTPLQFEAQAKP